MINNYQRDAGEEDDRDSGSLTLLASLAEGDQVIIITIFMRIVVVWKMTDNNINNDNTVMFLIIPGLGGMERVWGLLPIQQPLQTHLIHRLPGHQGLLTQSLGHKRPSFKNRNSNLRITATGAAFCTEYQLKTSDDDGCQNQKSKPKHFQAEMPTNTQ